MSIKFILNSEISGPLAATAAWPNALSSNLPLLCMGPWLSLVFLSSVKFSVDFFCFARSQL